MKKQCEDNGLIIEFPNENWTDIDNNHYFKKFSGIFNNFKVMDCSWFGNQTLWLIELKRYYNPDNEKYISPDFTKKKVLSGKIRELLQKTICTLLLLNERYETIKIFPETISLNSKINIIHILKINPVHKDYLLFFNDKLKTDFEEFPMNVNALIVINYDDKDEFLNFVE